jgi:sterol desaturase/sphingolipid hydroxylase (fatty acid hydroxylase superfamily)
VAVLIFEILLNGCAMFNHANAAVPARAEAWLRHLLVTPDMHRIHHSWRRDETDANFGFCLPWWTVFSERIVPCRQTARRA